MNPKAIPLIERKCIPYVFISDHPPPPSPAPKLGIKRKKIFNPEAVFVFPFQFTKPQILFVDVDVGQLDYFMHGLKRKTDRKKSVFRKRAQIYKAVSSTENETLLFPENIDTEVCRRIAICLAEQRTS